MPALAAIPLISSSGWWTARARKQRSLPPLFAGTGQTEIYVKRQCTPGLPERRKSLFLWVNVTSEAIGGGGGTTRNDHALRGCGGMEGAALLCGCVVHVYKIVNYFKMVKGSKNHHSADFLSLGCQRRLCC
jgi:hypothetical protein